MAKGKKVKRKAKEPMVEIARSFAFKVSLGNYQTQDVFCSEKAECKVSESERVSEALYQFCKREVIRAVNDIRAELLREKTAGTRKVEIKDIARDGALHDAGATAAAVAGGHAA